MFEKKFSPFWKRTIVLENITLQEALQNISHSGLLILCVVSFFTKKFVGVITDSDIRKALLNGAALSDKAAPWINKNPVTASEILSTQELVKMCYRVGKREIPILNLAGELTDVFILGLYDERVEIDNYYENNGKYFFSEKEDHISNYLFIQAGGLGSRLRSVVNDRPKPLALIGGKPIIETIIDHAVSCGIKNYFVATNYLAEKIESFLSAEKFSSLNIQFVREKMRLGTAGAIGLIKHHVSEPIIVCNADVLSKVQYRELLEYHKKNHSDITVVLRPCQLTIPYGVVQISNNQIQSITEKPNFDFMVNAGIYILSPEMCREINENEYLDMPVFISNQITKKKSVFAYYLYEYWIDIGKPEDYYKANEDYPTHFMREQNV